MKHLSLAAILVLTLPILALAFGYNYIDQETMRDGIKANAPMTIVDICPAPQFAKGHLPGSIETNAYPVKTDAERAKLTPLLSDLKATAQDIVIVCPGGRGGAKRTYDYFVANGIGADRIKILEKGMNGWPYQTTTN